MGNRGDKKRKNEKERLRQQSAWQPPAPPKHPSTSPSSEAPEPPTPKKVDTFALLLFFLAAILACLQWGLSLIGIAVNLWLGAIILLLAFVLMVWAFWILERTAKWNKRFKKTIVFGAGIIYFGLVSTQMISQYHKDHPPPSKSEEHTFIHLERLENGRIDPPGVLLVPTTIDPKWGIAINLHFKNVGNYVARDIHMLAKTYLVNGETSQEKDNAIFDKFLEYCRSLSSQWSNGGSTWIPGQEGWITAEPLSFSVEEVNRLNFGIDTLYLAGRVTYRDGAGVQTYDICQWLQSAKDSPKNEMIWHECSAHEGQQ